MLDLVSFQVNGVKASKAGRDFKKIGLFFRNGEPDAGGFERREVPEPTVKRLDSQEIAAVLHASKRAASSRRDDVRRFIMKRKYSNPPAWVLPNGWSAPGGPGGTFPWWCPPLMATVPCWGFTGEQWVLRQRERPLGLRVWIAGGLFSLILKWGCQCSA